MARDRLSRPPQPRFLSLGAARRAGALAAAGLLSLAAFGATASAQEAVRASAVFEYWAAFAADDAPAKSCYAATVPVNTEATRENIRRGEAFLMVASYPDRGIENEIMVVLGFPADSDRPLTLKIGAAEFRFFNDGQEAWLERPSRNAEAIQAMRRGAKAFVEATSTRGTTIVDEYSLIGFTKTLEEVDKLCATAE